MFDEFPCCEVNSSGFDTTRFFGGSNDSQISEAEMVYGLITAFSRWTVATVASFHRPLPIPSHLLELDV